MNSDLFLWGAATSSHQIEGYNDKNDWWAWELAGNAEGGVRSGASTDHWNRFREDIRLASEMGLNTYRFSVEWSRIEPEEGRYDFTAIEWYRNLIVECELRGLLPMLTLHHFTSPLWFAQQGGFTWDRAHEKFSNYVKLIAKELGARIPLWCTLNEPMVLVAGTYLGKFMPPAEFSPQSAALANHQLLKSHVAAYRILHSQSSERAGPWKTHPLAVGIAHNMMDFLPDRRWHPIEVAMARVFRRFYNQSWLDAVTGKKQHFGVLGLVPYSQPVVEALGQPSVDFIGLNYYTKGYIRWRPRDAGGESRPEIPVGIAFARRKEPASDLGWAIHPQGLGKLIRQVARYGFPIYITENGIADRTDSLRPEYLRLHLLEVAKAIQEGVDIRGYYYWSLLDNFEWIKGFWPRFGLYQVDYETFERKKTASATLMQKIIQAHHAEKNGTPSTEVLAQFGKI